jgi:hypothetical protein
MTLRNAKGSDQGAQAQSELLDADKPSGGRREAQGMRIERNRSQSAPQWPQPKAAKALSDLAALWDSHPVKQANESGELAWRVTIPSKRGDKRVTWRKFASRAGALVEARLLHTRGIIGARVEGPQS